MKKVLLLLAAIFVLSAQNSQAQTDTLRVKTDTVAVTIQTLNKKLDRFLENQQKTNENLEAKINRANNRLQNLQNQSSLRWIYRESIPIIILIIIGLFIVSIIYILSINSFRNNKNKYDTIIRCTEMTGTVPNLIPIDNGQQRKLAIKPSARIYLFLSIFSFIIAFIVFLVSMESRGIKSYICLLFSLALFVITATLFIQFNKFNSEDNRTNQQ